MSVILLQDKYHGKNFESELIFERSSEAFQFLQYLDISC